MEKEINVAAILRDKPKGTKLYDVTRNTSVTLGWVGNEDRVHCAEGSHTNVYECNGTLLGYPKGMQILKPSKSMQYWSKFAWKKGNVLQISDSGFCTFEKWTSDDYKTFKGRYGLNLGKNSVYGYYIANEDLNTFMWCKVNNDYLIKQYLDEVERQIGGKLNLDTLEIEKSEPQFKDGDIVYSPAGDIMDEAIFIAKVVSKGILHNYIYMSKEDMIPLANSSFSVSGSLHDIRLATDSEKQQLFDALAKEGKRWNSETKQIEDLPKCGFKPFDKVLVRLPSNNWVADFFSNYDKENEEVPYTCIGGSFSECIPYNDKTAHLLGTTDDYEETN